MLRFLPQPMADNYLLEQLPGLTLADIDGMDVHRLARALQVRRIAHVEARRQLQVDGKLDAKQITPDEWRTIRYHDKLLGVE
jgi:hypothetical protein